MKKVLVAIFLFLSSTAFADVNLETKVNKDRITIGDRVIYDIIIEYDDKVEVEPLDIGANLGEFEIKDYHVEAPKKDKEGKWVSKTSYIITTFTTGEWTIPPIKVKYKDKDGNKKEIESKPLKIIVESVKLKPKDKDDIRPLKEPAKIKGKALIWFIVAGIILLIVGIFIAFYFIKKKKITEELSVQTKPADEVAIMELNALQDMKLIEKGMIKEYYIRLSDIIRKYIEGRFKLLALDMTTWELYQEMRLKRLERGQVDKIRDFLEDCDLVKFAKYIPASKEIEKIYNSVGEIVEITR